MQGELTVRINDQIAEIEFHHPKGNSLPRTLLDQLTNAIKLSGDDDEVKVIKLKSRGKTFCAGASFDELLAIQSLEQAHSFFEGFGLLIEAIKDCPKFVVAQVQGKAVGGGVGIIAACDYSIATEAAEIKLSELSIGFGPFVIAPAVIRKIGISAFSTLTIDSKSWKSAKWSLDKGLYNQIISKNEKLEKAVQDFCITLSTYSSEAMAEIKKLLWEGYDDLSSIHEMRAKLSGEHSQTKSTQDLLKSFSK